MKQEPGKAIRLKFNDGTEEVYSIHPTYTGSMWWLDTDKDCFKFRDYADNLIIISLFTLKTARVFDAIIVKDGNKHSVGTLLKGGAVKMHNPMEDDDHYEDPLS